MISCLIFIGLTILLPYLLSRNKKYKGCSLRVLTPASDKKLKSNQVRMASLLKKFRITFSGIVEVVGINSKPSSESISKFRQQSRNVSNDELTVGDEPLDKKTLRQIRLGELIREYSGDSKLVVITMPVPRKSVVSNLLYMSWLEAISADLDSELLFVRGNQTSVLTFYSWALVIIGLVGWLKITGFFFILKTKPPFRVTAHLDFLISILKPNIHWNDLKERMIMTMI